MERSQPRPAHGVYGFEVAGLDDPARVLGAAEPGWPLLRVVRAGANPGRADAPAPGTVEVGDDRAELWLAGGDLIGVERASLTVTYATRERFPDDVVLHPYLGLPASLASRWLGRLAFHGGAFVHDGRAWIVLGDKEAGKSSTLAWLVAQGRDVLTDDIAIVDGGVSFAGPRCVDLRADSARLLGGSRLGVVGARERWRVRLGEVPAAAPIGGFVHLEWADRLEIGPIESEGRLEGLVRQSVTRPKEEQAEAYLELAAAPHLRFARPRELAELDRSNAQLLEALP